MSKFVNLNETLKLQNEIQYYLQIPEFLNQFNKCCQINQSVVYLIFAKNGTAKPKERIQSANKHILSNYAFYFFLLPFYHRKDGRKDKIPQRCKFFHQNCVKRQLSIGKNMPCRKFIDKNIYDIPPNVFFLKGLIFIRLLMPIKYRFKSFII